MRYERPFKPLDGELGIDDKVLSRDGIWANMFSCIWSGSAEDKERSCGRFVDWDKKIAGKKSSF